MPDNNDFYIDKIKLPSDNTYYLHDSEARRLISNISTTITSMSGIIDSLSSYTKFLGTVAAVPTTAGVIIGDGTATATSGDIVIYGSKEFIFNGAVWQEFGDLDGMGDFAHANTGVATIPAQTITIPGQTITISGNVNIDIPSINVTTTADVLNMSTTASVTEADKDKYFKIEPTGTVASSGSITINSFTAISGLSITVPNTAAPSGAVSCVSVNNNELIFNYLQPTFDTVTPTGTTTVTSTFTGGEIYVTKPTITYVSSVTTSTTTTAASVTSTATINSQTATIPQTTVTVVPSTATQST